MLGIDPCRTRKTWRLVFCGNGRQVMSYVHDHGASYSPVPCLSPAVKSHGTHAPVRKLCMPSHARYSQSDKVVGVNKPSSLAVSPSLQKLLA
jgi:hypothetical protein